MVGLTQWVTNLTYYGGISIVFWYGPQLIRNECEHYSAGHWMVVCIRRSLPLFYREENNFLCRSFSPVYKRQCLWLISCPIFKLSLKQQVQVLMSFRSSIENRKSTLSITVVSFLTSLLEILSSKMSTLHIQQDQMHR